MFPNVVEGLTHDGIINNPSQTTAHGGNHYSSLL
jgi:hypothetical protein